MAHDEVPLVQVWVTTVDPSGRSHLEARWVPATGNTTTTPGYAAHAA